MTTNEHETGQWPPEVPPFRPPTPPMRPPAPEPMPSPQPILPTWEEPDSGAFERDVADRLLDERVVMVSGRLDETAANKVASQLMLLGRRNWRTPIRLHLSCSDSELAASLALADVIEMVGAPVHATVHGTLRGPAVAVLCAATERVAHRHALFVLSLPEAAGQGTAVRLASLAEQHGRQVAQLCRRIAEATGRPEEDVSADLDAGRLLSADEAEAYGLVQHTV